MRFHYAATGIAFHLNGLVVIAMTQVGPTVHLGIVLNASAASGIIAVDDGGTWAGATNLALPWP